MAKDNMDELVLRGKGELEKVAGELGKRIVGQRGMIEGMLTGLVAGGHVLVEGVPGLAKTLAVRTLAEVLDAEYKRIQFTPDLLPADLIGTMVYRQQTGEFLPRKGPVFTNILLADEINRAPAKVQSALLEAMEERQVTIGNETYRLPDPFFVFATQNPIEHEGTYPLPEAQVDRFFMKLKISYPDAEDELRIVHRMGKDLPIPVEKVLTAAKIKELKEIASEIAMDRRIAEYIVALVTATRETDGLTKPYAKYIEFGASTRASLCLYRASKVRALFEGRSFVIPDDVKTTVFDVLRHRLILSYQAQSEELESDDILKEVLKAVPVP
ncbi:MAG: MoxR family ATPase [Spirochaetales bacterium]|nr:MoxR family ATPase [Spirochaetales bacterium]